MQKRQLHDHPQQKTGRKEAYPEQALFKVPEAHAS
jgi:hypothetical protein